MKEQRMSQELGCITFFAAITKGYPMRQASQSSYELSEKKLLHYRVNIN
jgi:hypothetical protein